MHNAMFWTPIYKHDLSTDARELLRLCKREPKPILVGDFMRIYQGRMTPLSFIEKWQHLFSPPTRAKMDAMAARIDLHARKCAMLFIARLKRRVHTRPNTQITTPLVSPPAAQPRELPPRRRARSQSSSYLTETYVDNPRRSFERSLRSAR